MAFRRKQQSGNTVRPEAVPPTVEPPVVVPLKFAELPRRLLSYQVANLQGLGNRRRQEDSFAFVNAMDVTEIRRNGLLAVVADGMGGMKDGKVASETAIASLKQDFDQMDRSDIPGQLQTAVLRAGRQVYEVLGGDGGSTVVACVFFDQQMYFASVGDSFLYLLRDGELLRLNREHNMLHRLYMETIHQGGMDPEPAREDEEAAALTQFLGMDELEDVDLLRRPLRLHEGDLFLLCSDGVAGVLTEDQICACLSQSAPQDMCEALRQAVLAANNRYQDNFTALVVRCGY